MMHLAALALLLTTQAAPPAAKGEAVVVESYEGAHAKNDVLKRVLPVLPDYCRRSLPAVTRAFGIDPGALKPGCISVRVMDGRGRIIAFLTDKNGPDKARITLQSEFIIAGWDHDLEQIVLHEMVHAVLLVALGPTAYFKCPRWLHEGLASHVAKQEEDIYQQVFCCHDRFAREPDRIVNGLGPVGHTSMIVNYVEYLHAVGSLLGKDGDAGLPKLYRRLKAEEPVVAAVEAMTGEDWGDFVQRCKEEARLKVESRVDDAHKAYCEVLDADASGAIKAAERFLAAHRSSYLVKKVRLILGRALKEEGDVERALKHLGEAARTPPMLYLEADAMFLMAEIHLARGAKSTARGLLSEILAFHPWFTRKKEATAMLDRLDS